MYGSVYITSNEYIYGLCCGILLMQNVCFMGTRQKKIIFQLLEATTNNLLNIDLFLEAQKFKFYKIPVFAQYMFTHTYCQHLSYTPLPSSSESQPPVWLGTRVPQGQGARDGQGTTRVWRSMLVPTFGAAAL